MKIKNISWISKEALEAEVTITDGKSDLLCFSQPFNYNVDDELEGPLYTLDARQFVRSESNELKVERLDKAFTYCLTGKLSNKQNRIIQIGEIEICVDASLPGDINEGEFVSFKCDRIDL